MKFLVIGLAASVVSATPASDPTVNLRKQFVSGHGVTVTESARTRVKGIKGDFFVKTTGAIGFTSKGAPRYDLVSNYTSAFKNAQPEPIHAIKLGSDTYVNGFTWRKLHTDKPWIRFRAPRSWGETGQRGEQLVDVLNPEFLRIVISECTKVERGVYRGVLNSQTLQEDLKLTASPPKISVKLYLDDGLPTRLITAYRDRTRGPNRKGRSVIRTSRVRVDTRYTDWGTDVTVDPPPAGDVAHFKLPSKPKETSKKHRRGLHGGHDS